ncbi:hypothetical protein RJ639_009938 [Escallonia herrerae]|uniref:MULE transposase domain-containing protein n=1 Tax=Escallonia herrerae TaxID=1293975 RepID=A0AA88VTX4_9ASTE|nr:hypothetical protein RJ639_009938 [Escallonia herrerae]
MKRMLRKHNPSTCFKVETIGPSPDLAPVFKRVYVRFEAYKIGFLAGCRSFIGLDGCHLKGLYDGELLSVVARDVNDNMFPVAVAIVEAETRDSWSWFLTELIDDLGGSGSLFGHITRGKSFGPCRSRTCDLRVISTTL